MRRQWRAQEAAFGEEVHVERLGPAEGEVERFEQLGAGAGFEKHREGASGEVFAMDGSDGHAGIAQQDRAVLTAFGDQQVVQDRGKRLWRDLVAPGQGVGHAKPVPVAAQGCDGRALRAVARQAGAAIRHADQGSVRPTVASHAVTIRPLCLPLQPVPSLPDKRGLGRGRGAG